MGSQAVREERLANTLTPLGVASNKSPFEGQSFIPPLQVGVL